VGVCVEAALCADDGEWGRLAEVKSSVLAESVEEWDTLTEYVPENNMKD
jgi:hypothetical protein